MRSSILNGLILCLLGILLTSGAPKIKMQLTKEYPPLDYREEVKISSLNDKTPILGEELAILSVGDNGFTTKCNFEEMIEYAKVEARKIGGNTIKIIEHKNPDFVSTCHRIIVKIYKLNSINILEPKPKVIDSVTTKKDYALVHIYRTGSIGFLVGYDLHLGDSVICRVETNWRKTIRIKKDGYNTLWARTETKAETPINIKLGEEYYIRCGISMGAFVGRPSLELVNNDIGKLEYSLVKFEGMELPDLLILKDGREIECKIHSQDNNNVYFSFIKKEMEIKTQINKSEVKEIQVGE